MSQDVITVLLIEDDASDAVLVRRSLTRSSEARRGATPFHLIRVDRLETGLARLANALPDVLLVDLALPDADGLDALARVRAAAPATPIIALISDENDGLAVEAIAMGAQECLVKGEIHERALSRTLRYAIERQRLRAQIRDLSLVDDETGLFNRRGFLMVADQAARRAQRTLRPALVLTAEARRVGPLSDAGSAPANTQTVKAAAAVLADTLRASDVVAHFEGQCFAALAPDATPTSEAVIRLRLQRALDRLNRSEPSSAPLTLRLGAACMLPDQALSLEGLLEKAARQMQETPTIHRTAM